MIKTSIPLKKKLCAGHSYNFNLGPLLRPVALIILFFRKVEPLWIENFNDAVKSTSIDLNLTVVEQFQNFATLYGKSITGDDVCILLVVNQPTLWYDVGGCQYIFCPASSLQYKGAQICYPSGHL